MRQKLLLLFALFFSVSQFISAQISREDVALDWLIKNEATLGIQPTHDFEMLFSRSGLSGDTFRYYQMLNGVQVYDAEVTIHVSNNDEVTFHASTYDKTVSAINTTPSITLDEAFELAKTNLNVVASDILQNTNKLYVYNKQGETKLIYRVYIHAYSKTGAWEVMVDAQTGAIISSKDIAYYYKHKHDTDKDKDKDKKKKEAKANSEAAVMATGSGFIFDTDPLTATTSAYGGQYVDGNDATNATLDAARTAVTLLDIELAGGNYRLRGPYTEIAELDSPNKGLFIQSSDNFEFNRFEDGFEAVNVYYHTDKSMRYINNDLGISLAPPQNGGVIRFDPHGAGGADNSFYTAGTLVFGEGCVDDGEDADVILHELGHGLHDWITNGGLSQVNGLSEGSGDYWANSYKRNLGQWSTGDAARNWVFGWDGHNVCWPGRSTVYPNLFPGGLGGGIHAEGQIWASSLMEIWEIIGREQTDKAFLEGLGMTNGGTNHEQAATAVRQAAIDMGYTCVEIDAITARFEARGYTLPAYTCVLSVDEFAASNISIYPNPTNGTITLKNITQEYDVNVYNMLGQSMKQQTVNSASKTIDVTNLATGTYFIKFKGYDKVLKFIKL